MKIIITIITLLLLGGCIAQKDIDDTEHLWIGDNGVEFYE